MSEYDPLAEVYDRWASGDPASIPCRDFYVDLCRQTSGTILELGIGTGRIALDVACTEHPVFGVDVSRTMLAECQRRAHEKGLLNHLSLMCADLRAFDL